MSLFFCSAFSCLPFFCLPFSVGAMPKLKITFLIPVLLISFHPGYPALAQSGTTKTATATISGRVTLKGEPAPNVVVSLQNPLGNPSRPLGMRANTDESGRFRITVVAAGRYVLGALAPSFISPSERVSGPQGKAINVAEGENVENLEIALNRGAVITGRVTDANDRPLVNEQVDLTKLDEGGKPIRNVPGLLPFMSFNPLMFSTDDRGVYRIYGLAAGRYLVSVGSGQREGELPLLPNRIYYHRTYHPDTTDQSRAKVIVVGEGDEATGVDVKTADLKKTYDIFGRVENTDTGQPLPGVRVVIGALSEGGKRIGSWGGFNNITDAQGQFQIQSVLPGRCAVFADGMQDRELYGDPVIVDINDGDVTGVVIKLRRGVSISGVAVIEGSNDPAILSKLSQIEITAGVISEELMLSEGSTAKQVANGAFVIRGLRPGLVRLSISYKQDLGLFSVLRVEHNGALQTEGIRVEAGEQVIGVRVVIGHGTTVVRGQLRITGGALPEDANLFVKAVRLGTTRSSGRGGQVDGRGQFAIEGLTAGEYELKLSVSFRLDSSPEKEKLAARMSKATQSVTVGNAQETRVTFIVDLAPKEGDQ